MASNVQGLRLLLVEDEYVLGCYMSQMLEEWGAHVVGPVASVSDALTLLDRAPEIDAAILDVNLGDESVFPVADVLRREHVPFVFASAYDPAQMPERFRDVQLCSKPIDPGSIRNALSRLR